MPIIDLQRGVAESGRIRIGQLVPSRNGSRPAKLDTFRLTSADRRRIDQVAALYGGAVTEWAAPSGRQWQVVTATAELEVVVPPHELAFSQWYELWSAGGCQRRCDGVTEQISEGPCKCDPEQRQCEIHTRLSVMLRDLPGLGVWRLDTQGWYAARELRGAVEILQIAAGHGALLPARLRLEQRSVKRIGADGKPETRRYAVPVLDIEISPAQLLSGGAQPIALEQAARPPLTPVPRLPGPSIAEQSQPPAERPRRANAAAEIPASGRSRAARAAEQSGGTSVERGESQTTRLSSAPPDVQPDPAYKDEIAYSEASPEPDPIEVMADLVRAAGKDPDAIRAQLGYERWEDAPAEVVAQLTAKARTALMDQAEAIATAPPAEPPAEQPAAPVEPAPKQPARRSRAKKES